MAEHQPRKKADPNLVRVFRRYEPKDRSGKLRRVATIAYRFDADQKKAWYGGAIWRRDEEKECFNKKAHLNTARGRLMTCPVELEVDGETLDEVEMKIRRATFTRGVKGKRLPKVHDDMDEMVVNDDADSTVANDGSSEEN